MRLPKPSPQSIQLSILALGFLWGVYTFIWQQILVPLFEDPKLEIDAKIDRASSADDGLVVLSLTLSNPNKRTIYLGDARWALYSIKFLPGGDKPAFYERVREISPNSIKHVELSSVPERDQLLAVGGFFPNSSFPSEYKRTSEVVVKIPSQDDVINLEYFVPHAFKKPVLPKEENLVYSIKGSDLIAEFCSRQNQSNSSNVATGNLCLEATRETLEKKDIKGSFYINFNTTYALSK